MMSNKNVFTPHADNRRGGKVVVKYVLVKQDHSNYLISLKLGWRVFDLIERLVIKYVIVLKFLLLTSCTIV